MDATQPFESIESALEFIVLLEAVAQEVSDELRDKLRNTESARYRNGLNLALYKIKQLSFHVQKSRRILHDLTRIHRVLVESDADLTPPGNNDARIYAPGVLA